MTDKIISKKNTVFKNAKLLSTTAMLAIGLYGVGGLGSAHAADDWTDHTVTSGGSIDIQTPTSNVTNIRGNGAVIAVQGDGDIKGGHTVNVTLDSSGSKYVLTDIEDSPTEIYGTLNSNGEIYILDVNGFIFGEDLVVDTASFAAIAGKAAQEGIDFYTKDKMEFDIVADAKIDIRKGAQITVAEGGLAAFVAPHVSNKGIINARMGTVGFGAGQKATLDLYGDGLVELEVNGELADALIENSGQINAQGGRVEITAKAAKSAVDNIINVDGVIDVSSIEQHGGKIILSGGDQGVVKVGGTLKASGKTGGGDIDIKGENISLEKTAKIEANAIANGDGGTVIAYADNLTSSLATIEAKGGDEGGDGGFVEISATNKVGFAGSVDTSAPKGTKGTFLIDPKTIELGTYGQAAHDASILADNVSGGTSDVTIDEQALANTLRTSDVALWATESISTTEEIDVSTWIDGLSSGITTNDLSLSAPEINILHDFILGTGKFALTDISSGSSTNIGLPSPTTDIDVDTVNLDGTVFRRETVGGALTQADKTQISGIAHTVNVFSSDAQIQQAIYFADGDFVGNADINLAADTYQEQIIIDKNIDLIGAGASDDGDDTNDTIIQSPETLAQTGVSPNGGRNYGIAWVHDTDDVNISGIKFDGSTNTQDAFFDDTDRFQGVIYQRAGGSFANNWVDNVISSTTEERSGFAVLATNKEGPATTLDITDNLITDFQKFGIGFVDPNLSGEISGNNIIGNKEGVITEQSGILVGWGANANVQNNTIESSDLGLWMHQASGNTFANNTVFDTRNGAFIDQSANTMLNDNVFFGNTTIGIDIVSSDGTVVSGDTIDNYDIGINVFKSDDVTITGTNIDNIGTDAIFTDQSKRLTITNNEIGQDGGIDSIGENGIEVNGGTDSIITGNDIRHFVDDGIGINFSDNTLISENTVNGIEGIDMNEVAIFSADSDNIVISNNDLSFTSDGVKIRTSDNANISSNTITEARKGIQVLGSDSANISGNTMTDIDLFGVWVNKSPNGTISDNNISGATKAVFVEDSANTDVIDNILNGSASAKSVGIDIVRSQDSFVSGGTIDDFNRGINVFRSDDVEITGVNIDNIGTDAIYTDRSNRLIITNNEIGQDGAIDSIGENGIEVLNGNDNIIDNNNILHFVDDGIGIGNADRTEITNNTVNGIEGVDIDEVAIFAANSDDILIQNNDMSFVADGIKIRTSDNADILDNEINDVRKGIQVQQSDNVTIDNNDIEDVDLFGIWMHQVDTALVVNNDIDGVVGEGSDKSPGVGIFADDNSNNIVIGQSEQSNFVSDFNFGIRSRNSDNVTVEANVVDNSNNGIHSVDTPNIDVLGNVVTNSDVDGIYVENGDVTNIVSNSVSVSGDDGIQVQNVASILIDQNIVLDSSDDGIVINEGIVADISDFEEPTFEGDSGFEEPDFEGEGQFQFEGDSEGGFGFETAGVALVSPEALVAVTASNIIVTDNTVTDTGDIGILIGGQNNNSVVLAGNDVTNFTTGARFESGAVDVSNLGNPNTFTDNNDGTPVGLQFDGDPDNLTIVGETLGATEFDGFTNEGSFYVRFEDGAILDPIANTPIVIDAQNVSFDGLVPSAAPFFGTLSSGDLAFIENRLYDADDAVVNGRGQIFVGLEAPAPLGLGIGINGLDNIEDFFNEFSFLDSPNGLSVIIVDPPSTDLPQGTDPGDLNAINPAAGGEGAQNAQNLAEIEPDAGDDDSACWTDAVSGAQGGGITSYTFGGSFEESLADAASCSTAGL